MSDCLSVNVYPDLQVDRVKTTAERAQITCVLPRLTRRRRRRPEVIHIMEDEDGV